MQKRYFSGHANENHYGADMVGRASVPAVGAADLKVCGPTAHDGPPHHGAFHLPTHLTAVVLSAACLGWLPAHAQYAATTGGQTGTTQNNGRGQQNRQSVLPLPKGISKVISIDSQNMLMVEMDDPDDPTQKQYTAIRINHVYSGGIARLLGGTIITTEELVSPALNQGNGNGNNNGNGNGGFPGPSAYSNNGNNNSGDIGFFNPTAGGAASNGYAPNSNGATGNYLNGYTQNPNGQSFSSPYTFANPSYSRNSLNVPLRVRAWRPQAVVFGPVPQPNAGG